LSDLPQAHRTPPRHWLEYVSTAAALLISLVSLWVAVETEIANQQMVAASSWPFIQGGFSNADPEGHHIITATLTNSGVGPAKIRTFELFWKGRSYRSSHQLLRDCCGYEQYNQRMKAPGVSEGSRSYLLTSAVEGRVVRAGETIPFITLPLGSDNSDVWHALDGAVQGITTRICYCSVFDQCWLDTDKNLADSLNAIRVDKCPVPKVSYDE
jgi:hypothetical protein